MRNGIYIVMKIHNSRPIPNYTKSTKIISMRKLIAMLCLTITTLIGSMGTSFSAGEFPNSLDGLCLDNVEEGCMPRFLPLKDFKITYCEASCTLTNPVKIKDMSGILYKLSCRTDDDNRQYSDRIMLLKETPENAKKSVMLWIDSTDIFEIVHCPTP